MKTSDISLIIFCYIVIGQQIGNEVLESQAPVT